MVDMENRQPGIPSPSDMMQHSVDRRSLLRRAVLAGAAFPVVGGLLAACGGNPENEPTVSGEQGQSGSSGGSSTTTTEAASPSASAGASGTTTGSSGTPKKGGVAVIPVTASPTSWNLLKSDWITWEAITYLYDQLLTANEDEEFQPMLATSWEVSDDGLNYTLKLRDDVKFHDGTPFNSAAAKFNLERYLEKEDSAFYPAFEPIQTVDTPDDTTVKLTLKKVSVDMLYNLAGWGTIQISPTVAQKLGDNYSSNPTGTGPFKFKSYVPDSHAEYVRNDDYWQEPALLDGVQIKIIPEPSVQLDNLQAKTVDVVYGVNPNDVQTVEDLNVPVEARLSPGIRLISLNLTQAPTTELAVRKAIARAINRDEIIKKVLYDYAVKARGGAMPGTPYDFQDVPMIEYDPDEAGKILDDAGWKMGSDGIRERDGNKLFLSITTRDSQEWTLYSQIFQEQLKEIGIDSKISSFEWGTYLDNWRENKGEWNLTYMSLGGTFSAITGIQAGWNPDAFWTINQIGKATDPEMKQLSDQLQSIYDEMLETIDLDKRLELGKQAQMLYQEHQLAVWLWHPKSINAVQPYLKDYDLQWHGRIFGLNRAWLDK